MIKGVMRTALGQPMLFLGLSGENVTRLAAGEPIRVRAQELAALGLPQLEVVIHYGRTEQAILDEMAQHGLLCQEAAGDTKQTLRERGGQP